MTGCPAHQKATFVQDAGARGIIFVQHEGKKPQQIRLPAELPKPIVVPLVMVAMDSGIRILEQIHNAHVTQTPQIRFVFSDECALDKFQVHPDDDPLAMSVHARLEAAHAGFLTLTTADSGSSVRSTVTYEFLKPSQSSTSPSALLPLGKRDLALPDRILARPCVRPDTDIASRSRQRTSDSESLATRTLREALQDHWVAVPLLSKCSLATQLAYFAAMQVSGVIFGDAAFPASSAAHATESSIPFVLVSRASLISITQHSDAATAHVQVEFTGESASCVACSRHGLVSVSPVLPLSHAHLTL